MSKMVAGKILVAVLLVLMAMSGPVTRAAARPLRGEEVYAEEPSSGGSASIVMPSPMPEWRGHMLLPLEMKTGAGPSCDRSST
jgi:hypothetical protein